MSPQIYIHDEGQCDPKKCTARKMIRFNLGTEIRTLRQIPWGAIVLNPSAEKAVSREDADTAESRGIVVMDLSWRNIDRFPKVRSARERALPLLFAANPVNWGKPQKLSSVEAVAAALYIMDFKEQAREVLSKFRWGEQFLILNREPLDRYSEARTSEEVVRIQEDYL